MPKEYQIALVVGRFQPFHNGHLYLLHKSLKMADQIKIAIGSANSSDKNSNPLSYQQRKLMLQKVIKREGWGDRVLEIFPSNDFASDLKWQEDLIKKAGEFDIAVGNNDWTNSVLEQVGYRTKTIRLKDRTHLQGVVIRDLIRSSKPWEERVPDYLIEITQKQLQ